MTQVNTDDYHSIFLQDTPLIDTRAPVEFSRGAFPCAHNLPLMSDDERCQVGTHYKKHGQDAAIELGRKLVTPALQQQRTQRWLDFIAQHPHAYLYCFRGGLRSRISQQWISESGVDLPYVEGGYKAMRRFLISQFELRIKDQALILINGRTGCGKTILLNKLQHKLDLEGLALHRGSSFGRLISEQPTPINFENNLSIALLKQTQNNDSRVPIFVEAEGRLIGRLCLPDSLWARMAVSPSVVLEAPMAERVNVATQDYVVDLLMRLQCIMPFNEAHDALAERHKASLHRIRKRLGGVKYQSALKLLDEALLTHKKSQDLSAYTPFIELLLTEYYDPMYDYQAQQKQSSVVFAGSAEDILAWSTEQEHSTQ
jgi:tRNA 2-selenouridine synthase